MSWAEERCELGLGDHRGKAYSSPCLKDFWRAALQENQILRCFYFPNSVLLNSTRVLLMLSSWPPFYLFVMSLLPPLSTVMRALKRL